MRVAWVLLLFWSGAAMAQERVEHSGGICIGTPTECAQKLEAMREGFDLRVEFALNSAELTPEAQQRLAQFAEALRDNRLKQRSFVVEGHTDAYGTPEYNLDLSARRAQAVVDFLAGAGVQQEQMSARGKGMTQPRVANPYDPTNRRVEMRVE